MLTLNLTNADSFLPQDYLDQPEAPLGAGGGDAGHPQRTRR